MRDWVYEKYWVYVGLTSSKKDSCVVWFNGEPDDHSPSGA